MTSNIDRDIGNMDARLGALEADMHEVRTDVRDIRDTLLNVKGGWRVLVAVGALSSAFTAFLIKIGIPFFPIR